MVVRVRGAIIHGKRRYDKAVGRLITQDVLTLWGQQHVLRPSDSSRYRHIRASAAPKVGFPNASDGAAPPGHAGMYSGACSNCRLSLLNSLRTRQGMPLMDRLERRGGLFLDSASTLFFGGDRSGSGELPEDSSSSAAASLSSGRIGSLPLFYLTGGAGWLLPRAFSIRSPSKRARRRSFSYYRWSARLCNSAICLHCSSCFASISLR